MSTNIVFNNVFSRSRIFNTIDITATLRVIGNRAFSSRTKHITLRFFNIRELVEENKITTHYILTENQLADIWTKHLNRHRLQQLRHMIKNF